MLPCSAWLFVAALAAPLPLDPPAAPGASFPALAAEASRLVTAEHELLLTWVEPAERGARWRFSRLTGAMWSRPVTLAEGVQGLDPRDPVSLTVIDTQAVRRTLLARAGELVVRSGDGGRDWSRLPGGPWPFVAFAGGDEGGWAFWHHPRGATPAALMGARVLAGGTELTADVAPGTATAAAMTWDGPVVVYRDAAGRVSSIHREDARWTVPRAVQPGPPHALREYAERPLVTATGRQVAVAWVAEGPGGPRLHLAFSRDGGRGFGPPITRRWPGLAPASLLALVHDDEGGVVILWQGEGGGNGAPPSLRLTRLAADGRQGADLVLATPGAELAAGAPQLVRAGARLAVAWSEGAPRRLRVVALPLAEVPGLSPAPASASAAAAPAPRGRGRVGEMLPATERWTLAGERGSFAALRGRVVLLNAWASWCQPCLAEMPELKAIHQRFGPDGLAVVSLNVDVAEARETVRALVAEHQLPFPVWLDPESHLAEELGVESLPVTWLIDANGTILWRQDSAIQPGDRELDHWLRRALAEQRRGEPSPPGD